MLKNANDGYPKVYGVLSIGPGLILSIGDERNQSKDLKKERPIEGEVMELKSVFFHLTCCHTFKLSRLKPRERAAR